MGLFDFLKPKDKSRQLLMDAIAYNADIIQRDEGKNRSDAEYLAICLLVDDLGKRPNGREGYQKLMDILANEYRPHLNDIITYVAWSTGKIILKPEFEAAMRARHARGSISGAALKAAVGNLFEPPALIRAIGELIPQYHAEVIQGSCKSPACTRRLGDPRGNVRDIWEDTRLESLVPLFTYGASNAMAVCKVEMQRDLFHAFQNERPHLKFPHVAKNNEVHDTTQAIFQCIIYLSEQCFKVGTNYDVYDGAVTAFEKKCSSAYDWWQQKGAGRTAYLQLSHGERPPLMFYVLWAEATRLAKEIAIASIYGSSLESALASDIRWARENFGDDHQAANEWIDEFKAGLALLRSANEPEDLLEKRQGRQQT
jgi:hypothetical protein